MMKKFSFILLALLLTGCLGSKKISEYSNITKQSEKLEVKKDSSNVSNTNKAVNDNIFTPVPSTNNPELDALVDEVLSKLNTSKTSGSNSYLQQYDKNKRQLHTNFTIGETKDVAINTTKDTNSETSFEQNIDQYIWKKITTLPWWAYLIVAFLLRNQLVGLLSFFFPGIRTIKTVNDFKKRLTPKIRSPVQ